VAEGDGRRVALVTGASREVGIGAAIARRLSADGLRVVVHGWSPADAEQSWGAHEGFTEDLAGELGTLAVTADLAEPEAPATVVGACVAAFGRLDVVVANHARSSNVDLAGLTAAELDLTYAVNVRATLLLVQALAARFERPDGGRVVLFTSGQYHGAMAGELPYIASKGALHQLTKSLAFELAARGITVNTVDPGPTDTGYADDAGRDLVARIAPRGRWGTPQEAARLVSWLVSEDADWVTGQVIASDGGWSAGRHAG
jgi:3-oxoacyl-[acyl-carrier protein] reductase